MTGGEPTRLMAAADEPLPEGERWRHALLCAQWRTCENRGHTAPARKRWRMAMSAATVEDAARVLHYSCDYWHDTSIPFLYRSSACGRGAAKHIAHIARLPWLVESWRAANPERTR